MLLCTKPLRVNLGGNRKSVGDFQNFLGENSKKLQRFWKNLRRFLINVGDF